MQFQVKKLFYLSSMEGLKKVSQQQLIRTRAFFPQRRRMLSSKNPMGGKKTDELVTEGREIMDVLALGA